MGSSFSLTLNDLYDEGSFSNGVGRNHVNFTPGGKAMPLKTSGATAPNPQRSLTTWSASDILQGATNTRPTGATYDVFNQTLSSDLAQILTDEGGADELLGGRKNFAPYDIIQRAGNGSKPPIAGIVDQALAGTMSPGGMNVRTEPAVNGDVTVADVTNGTGGITTVAQSIAGSVQKLFDAAKADGILMGGGGYRSHQRQIELRRINGCPDVWTAKASSCRTPTAIPGTSYHETGLAIDFTQNGKTLTRSSSGFNWMVANAATFGLKNLPSEAWHWSVSGK